MSDALAQLLYASFLIMAVVMLMNMMIALLSNTYQHVEDNAFHEWSYRKAATIGTYCAYHPVPVPFNILSLTYGMIRYMCRKIRCNNRKDRGTKQEIYEEMNYISAMHKTNKPFRRLMADLESQYISVYGDDFPMADDKKLDHVIKETEGNHQLTGHIAERVFRYDWGGRQQMMAYGAQEWESKGFHIIGQRLSYNFCGCRDCEHDQRSLHGARYATPLSTDWPGFEVLMQELGESHCFTIGICSEQSDLHRIPAWHAGHAAGLSTDGMIFDVGNPKGLHNDTGNMGNRGDVLSCEVLFHSQDGDDVPILFKLNGRDYGQAVLKCSSDRLYPFISSSSKGCILHFRLCYKKPIPSGLEPAAQQLQQIIEKLDQLNKSHVDLQSNYMNLQQEIAALRSEI